MKTKRLIHGAAASVVAALMLTSCGGTEALEESCARIAAMQDEYGRMLNLKATAEKSTGSEFEQQITEGSKEWSDIRNDAADDQLKEHMAGLETVFERYIDFIEGDAEHPSSLDDTYGIRLESKNRVQEVCDTTPVRLTFRY